MLNAHRSVMLGRKELMAAAAPCCSEHSITANCAATHPVCSQGSRRLCFLGILHFRATAPPRTIGKITEGSLKRLGRGTQRNASFAQAERLLRAKSREKSAVAQLHLFVSSLCSPRLDYPDVDLHAAQIFTVSQRGA